MSEKRSAGEGFVECAECGGTGEGPDYCNGPDTQRDACSACEGKGRFVESKDVHVLGLSVAVAKPAKERSEKRWLRATLPNGEVVRAFTRRGYTAVLCVGAPMTGKSAKGGEAARWEVTRWAKYPNRLLREKKLLEEQYLGARKLSVVPVVREDDMFKQTRITKKQREALELLVISPRNPFDFGSTTVNHLRALGLIESLLGKVVITEAGRQRLAEELGP